MFICKFCNKEYDSKNAHTNHVIRCGKNPERLIQIPPEYASIVYNNNTVCCVECKLEMSYKQLTNHYQSLSCKKPSRPVRITEQCIYCNRVPKMNMESHYKICRKVKRPKVWDEESRAKHSASMKDAVKRNPDSYTKNNICGRVKQVEYNGVMLKGTWEVKTAMWLDGIGEQWQAEVNPQKYIWNRSEHLYFPDFYLPDKDIYIEVKGYKTDRDEAKWSQFTKKLVIIDKRTVHILNDLTIEDVLHQFLYFRDLSSIG